MRVHVPRFVHRLSRLIPLCRPVLIGLATSGMLAAAAAAAVPEATAAPARVDGPDIIASATIAVIPGGPGSTITCSGSMRNDGNVTVTATIIVSCPVVMGGWTCGASGGATCPISTGSTAGHTTLMPPGAAIGFHAGRGVVAGTHTISVQTDAPGDIDPSNNTASASVTYTPPPPRQSDVRTSLVGYPLLAGYGQLVEYRVEVENLGPDEIVIDSLSSPLRLHAPDLRTEQGSACTAFVPAQCQTVGISDGAAAFRVGLHVGGRVVARYWGRVRDYATGPQPAPQELVFSTSFNATGTLDGNPNNNHAPLLTPLCLFCSRFGDSAGPAQPSGN